MVRSEMGAYEWVRVPQCRIVWAVRVAGVVLTLFFAMSLPVGAQERSAVTEELRSMYQADQADRQFTSPPTDEDWKRISARDAERLRRVYVLLKGDSLSVAEDFYDAAMVLQHGDSAEDVLLAHILATAAGFRGDERG